MSGQTFRVLHVEDNPDDQELTWLALSKAARMRFDVRHAFRLDEAISILNREPLDVLLFDLQLPDSAGLSGLAAIRQQDEDIPIIVLTGTPDEELALRSLHQGAQDYQVKSDIGAETLARVIQFAVQRQQLVQQVTSTKRMLEKKNRRLKKLYRTAHEFVDNVSHEFRTPLTVIKEYASLLREEVVGPMNDEQSRLLDVIGDRADDLNTMVDDMLDVSKLESGLLGVVRKNHRIDEVIQDVLPALQRKANVRGARLSVECAEDLPEVYCDAEKVGRIIINLTINAIKFCRDPGAVQLRAETDSQDDGVIIGVTDNGPGIDQEHLKEIFARFKQLHTDCRSSVKGFGLGLNIAKELVDLNLGGMSVESEPGRGSTFSFTLPPANPSRVMHRYLERIEHMRNGSTVVSLIRGELSETADAAAADDVDAMLAYLLRRNDLLFRIAADRWLIVLPIDQSEIEEFLARAKKSFQEINRNRPFGPLPEVQWRVLGTRQLASGKQSVMEQFEKNVSGVGAGSQSSVDSQYRHTELTSN